MDSLLNLQNRLLRTKSLPAIVITLMLLLLGLTIYFGNLKLRENIRSQISRRDGEILHAVALMQQIAQAEDADLGGEIEYFADQFNLALQVSQLNKGVIAARLYDAQGKFTAAFPANVAPNRLPEADLAELRRLKSASHFQSHASLAGLFDDDRFAQSVPPPSVPLLQVSVPLHRLGTKQLSGIVEFVIDGSHLATEFATLDRSLLKQAGATFCAGAIIIVLTLAWAFRHLQKTNRLLVERTQNLLRANEELTLAAKTSAVGAVTSHLIHGLANPLSGLQDFVASRGGEETLDAEWQTALASTRRMQSLVDSVVRVLGEELAVERYEITLAELVDLLAHRQDKSAREAGVQFQASSSGTATIPNRDANLVILILENLLQNAIQASPPGKTVRLRAQAGEAVLAFEVEDEGPGFPETLRASLFRPCRSTKEGGSGIGLAICKQLANHLGADLELARSSNLGSVFSLSLPRFMPKKALATAQVLG